MSIRQAGSGVTSTWFPITKKWIYMYPYCAVAIEMYGGIYLLLIALQLIRHHILAVPTLEVHYIIN